MNLANILMTLFLTAAGASSPMAETAAAKPVACSFFSNDNAVKILGRSVTAVDGGMDEDTNGRSWKCTFSAADDKAGGPKIYFMIVKSTSDEAARSSFDSIRRSNNTKPGFEEWPGVGEEAIVHSDGRNFQLVIVRKGVKSFRIKVNPADGSSLDGLKSVASSLAEKL